MPMETTLTLTKLELSIILEGLVKLAPDEDVIDVGAVDDYIRTTLKEPPTQAQISEAADLRNRRIQHLSAKVWTALSELGPTRR